MVIDIATGGSSVPAWWTMGTGWCRPGALLGNFDFTGGPSTCTDYWMGAASGGLNWSQLPLNNGNRCRIKGVFALPAGSPGITSLTEGVEYYSFKAVIRNNQTVGLGACAGCNDEACIVLNMIALDQPSPNPPQTRLTNPAVAGHVVWQGWSTTDPNSQCPAITPARKQTWGSIKALYR
jgi:hypothetical protein